MRIRFGLICVILFFAAAGTVAQTLTGTIAGRVTDAGTKAPIAGATIYIPGKKLGALMDLYGKFSIEKVPVGVYPLEAAFVGYATVVKTDVVVESHRSTEVYIEMNEAAIQSGEVVVTPGYFEERRDTPASMTTFSCEEIRRAPGSGGDISRIIMGLPSLAKVNDQSNSLIVRGGSPMENEFLVDGVEVPNINHFPTQGATGGPIGIINADLISDVDFSAGGFPATYGDHLSAVMNMKLRDGNRTGRNTQLGLDFAGASVLTEGYIVRDKASYLLSARRSYLDVLVKTVNVGTTVAPSYGDAQLKISYDISPDHKLELLDIFSDDHNNPDRTDAVENKMVYYGNQDIYVNTAGICWHALWSRNIYQQSVLSYSYSSYKENWFETNGGSELVRNNSHERTTTMSTIAHIKMSDFHSVEIGGQVKYFDNTYGNLYSNYTDAGGEITPRSALNMNFKTVWGGGFVSYILQPVPQLTLTAGLRADRFRFTSTTMLSPRLSASYDLGYMTKLNGAAGVYFQDLPSTLLVQNQSAQNLPTPRCIQCIVGLEHMLSETIRLTLEVYQKNYSSFPIDPEEPGMFMVDELFYRYGFYFSHGTLTGDGKAQSRGIEATIQKKLATDFYGLASASYFRSRYAGSDGIWRNRVFDNRFIFGIEGGYRPGGDWEFSARWIFAGGVPYTPLNIEASRSLGRDVLDLTKIDAARLPDYSSLNVRVDKRFYFSGSNLVAYVSVWNAYNRKNVAQYFWSASENRVDVIYQWGLLPIFGVEYDF